MRILHYTLGLPPYRTGGLTKYSLDLIKEQIEVGNNICLLYPGHFKLLNKHVEISKNKRQFGIEVYELINPLPVPLLSGVVKPSIFFKAVSMDIYVDYLKELKPDIIHVHTLMGIHKEFFEAAKLLNIKLIFTTHDYFGLCTKVNFFDYKNNTCSELKWREKCVKCNSMGYSMKLIFVMQSRIYRYFKNNWLVIRLKKYLTSWLRKKNSKEFAKLPCGNLKEYEELRKYYLDIFSLIDCFHFNSSLAKENYEKYLSCTGEVINITHSTINDNRELKDFRDDSSSLRITFLGSVMPYKGFYLLVEALDELTLQGVNNWKLNVYGDNYGIAKSKSKENFTFGRAYKYSQLREIFYNTDILVVPSVCKETFGFVGLEALSYGVPVMVTENVGFKDMLINKQTGLIIKPSKEELVLNLRRIIEDRSILQEINNNIINAKFDLLMKSHAEKITELYNRVLKGRR